MLTLGRKLKFIESVFGRAYVAANGRNVEVRCPFCDPRDPKKKKLSIQVNSDLYHCWVCHQNGRSLLFLLRKFSTQEKVNEYVENFAPHLKNKAAIDVPGEEEFKLPHDIKLLALERDSKDPNVLSAFNYLKMRGVDDRDLWYHKISVSDQGKWVRRVLFPSFDATGKPNFIVGRSIDSNRMPKYQTPQNNRNSLVFNELNVNWKKRVVLCEGVFDSLKCGENAIPLLGSSLNEQSLLFERIVMHSTPVVVALDSDMIDTAVPRLVNKLQEYAVDATFVKFDKHDPGEMSKDEVQEVLSKPQSLDWFQYISSRLNSATKIRMSI